MARPVPSARPPKPGYLLFVQMGDGGPVHFEYAAHPRPRLYALQHRARSGPLSVLCLAHGTKADAAALAKRFEADLRPKEVGVWFDWYAPGRALLDHIAGLPPVAMPSAPKQARHHKQVLLTFPPESVAQLDDLSEQMDLTKSGVVVELLAREHKRVLGSR